MHEAEHFLSPVVTSTEEKASSKTVHAVPEYFDPATSRNAIFV
jgi:hypothetical protein